MRTSLKLVAVSFALGLGMWACGGDDEGSNSATAGSGGSMAGEGGSEPTTNAGSKATAGTSTTGGTETAGTAGSGGTAGVAMGGMAAGGAPVDVAGQAPVGGDTNAIGGAPIAGAPDNMAGAPASMGGAADAGGAGGAPAVTSCKQTGTAPVCSNLNAQLCTGVDGCSLSATPCGGSPKACTDILLQGECNSTAGCMPSQAGCVDDPDPDHPRTECSTHSNAPNCVSAGCTYQPCGGTAVACSSLDEAACATHASYCAWQ